MDPLSVIAGSLGSAALKELITFFWNQAAALVKKAALQKKAGKEKIPLLPAAQPAFMQAPAAVTLDYRLLGRELPALILLQERLAGYVTGKQPVPEGDAHLFAQLDNLQQLLETVYQCRFAGKAVQNGNTVAALDGAKLQGKTWKQKKRGTGSNTITGKGRKSKIAVDNINQES